MTNKGAGVIGFVLSLIGIILFIFGIPGIIVLILGILGLIFTIIQFKKGKTGLAIAGLVLSIIVIVLVIINIIAVIIVWWAMRGFIATSTGGAVSGCASIELSITGVDTTANTVTVKRNPNLGGAVELAKIEFLFENSVGGIKIIEKTSGIKESKEQVFNFISDEVILDYNKVSAYPVIKTESGDVVCDNAATWSD